MTTQTNCTQEPRLAHMEAALSSISVSLNDMKEILRSSIVFDERITNLRKDAEDREDRLRKLEISLASGRWQERVVWVIVAASITMLLKHYG